MTSDNGQSRGIPIPSGLREENFGSTIIVNQKIQSVINVKELLDAITVEKTIVPPPTPPAGMKPAARGVVSQKGVLTKTFPEEEGAVEGEGSRFKDFSLIGEGATAKVYAATDTNFDRRVALKLLKLAKGRDNAADIKAFVKEAAVTAQLEHPNIIPIYEVDADEDGNLYIGMRKIGGHSMKRHIELKAAGVADPAARTLNDLVRIFLKIGDALSLAHSKGVVHQDVKPENILIGDFGEVFLIDWGSTSVSEDEVSLTPAYMSPEQARGADPHPSSDVYSLGAVMFHVLLGRLPLPPGGDLRRFWLRRHDGEIERPSPEEASRIPPQLLAIVLKALEPTPASRYGSVAELASDLENYQAGLAVSAYRDTLPDFLRRWCKRNRQALWLSAAAVGMLAVFVAIVYQMKLKELAKWGRPVVEETFKDPESLRKRWKVVTGDWKVEGGRLVSGRGARAEALHSTLFCGPTAIEYGAEVLPGALEGDISAMWQTADTPRSYIGFQLGTLDNTLSRIAVGPATMAYSEFTPKPGVRYRIRAEVDRHMLRLFVDGAMICEHESLFAFDEGYVGLYANYGGKAFDNITIYSKGVAEKVGVLEVGDSFFVRKHFNDAEAEYDKVLRSHPGTVLADEALYKKGLCRLMTGPRQRALDFWSRLTTKKFKAKALFHELSWRFDEGDHDGLLSSLRQLYLAGDKPTRMEAVAQWSKWVTALRGKCARRDTIIRYLDMADEVFKDTNAYCCAAATVANAVGLFERTLTRYPEMKAQCGAALLNMGRFEELLAEYPAKGWCCVRALARMNRPDDILARYPDLASVAGLCQVADGRGEEVLDGPFKSDREIRFHALLSLGREREAVSAFAKEGYFCSLALLRLGLPEEVLTKYPGQRGECLKAKACLAVAKFAEGKRDEACADIFDVRISLDTYACGARDLFCYFILPPFFKFLSGEKEFLLKDMEATAKTLRFTEMQVPYHWLSFIIGRIDETQFLAQPCKLYATPNLLLAKGIRAEVEGKGDEALAFYGQFDALPSSLKPVETPFPSFFARWRIRELSTLPLRQ